VPAKSLLTESACLCNYLMIAEVSNEARDVLLVVVAETQLAVFIGTAGVHIGQRRILLIKRSGA
jgi:thiamine monophosphate synthase